MDRFSDERDQKILEKDKYTFFVLRRVIGGECPLLLTDHERLIICFTGKPFPVWIWTADDASESEMEKAYQLAKEESLLDGDNQFNVKYRLADYFIKRAAEDGKELAVTTNMNAYDCVNPVRPEKEADGGVYRCTPGDLEELVVFLDLFHREIGINQKSIEGYREDAKEHIKSGHMYFWKNEQGKTVASCRLAPAGELASINIVLTLREYRRKHYAENLVYQVSKAAREAGYVPMLYTDADYTASNACYEKIGYVLQGKLCTVG